MTTSVLALPAPLAALAEQALNRFYAHMTVSLEDLVVPEPVDVAAKWWECATHYGISDDVIGMTYGEVLPCIRRQCKSEGYRCEGSGPVNALTIFPRG